MICKNCGLAADLLVHSKEANYNEDNYLSGFPQTKEFIDKLAGILHKLCHNTCDCQHSFKVGEGIDWSRTNLQKPGVSLLDTYKEIHDQAYRTSVSRDDFIQKMTKGRRES